MFSEHCNTTNNELLSIASGRMSYHQVEINQAPKGALGQSMKNSYPVSFGCVPPSTGKKIYILLSSIPLFCSLPPPTVLYQTQFICHKWIKIRRKYFQS